MRLVAEQGQDTLNAKGFSLHDTCVCVETRDENKGDNHDPSYTRRWAGGLTHDRK